MIAFAAGAYLGGMSLLLLLKFGRYSVESEAGWDEVVAGCLLWPLGFVVLVLDTADCTWRARVEATRASGRTMAAAETVSRDAEAEEGQDGATPGEARPGVPARLPTLRRL